MSFTGTKEGTTTQLVGIFNLLRVHATSEEQNQGRQADKQHATDKVRMERDGGIIGIRVWEKPEHEQGIRYR
jgi:hypothetical protein